MASDVELERIAHAVAMLRPDLHPTSTLTWLRSEAGRMTARRPYADLAVAAVACYLDPNTKTPARLAQNGPWWATALRVNDQRGEGYLPGADGRPCPQPGHEHERADACRACAAERLAGDIDDPDPAPETVPELLDALAAAVQRARARKTTSKETR